MRLQNNAQCILVTPSARILGSWFIDIKKETDWQGRAHKGCWD